MKKLIVRIPLISDLHWLTVPVGKQKGQGKSLLSWIFERFIDIWKRYNVSFAIPRLLKKIAKLGSVDRIICNGDLVECEWNERGIVMDTDCAEVRKKMHTINNSSYSIGGVAYVLGDHELGYRLPLSNDPQGGISKKSIENFVVTIDHPWQMFFIGGKHFVLLCSSLMMQKTDHLPESERQFVEQMRLTQEAFIKEYLFDIPENEDVFVFLHDPDALVEFYKCIRDEYYVHNKNFTAFCGHMHAEWSLLAYKKLGKLAQSKYAYILPVKIRQWAKSNRLRLELFEKYNLQIIPAPGGMMGIGGGFKVLNLFDDGTYEIETHKV
jgi:hypothetical protein